MSTQAVKGITFEISKSAHTKPNFITVSESIRYTMADLSKHKQIEIEHPGQYILSIRLEKAGIYFSIYNPSVNNSFQACSEKFPAGEDYLHSLENFVYEYPELLQPYKKVYILLQSNKFTFVPRDFEPSGETDIYYRYCFPGTSDRILENRLEQNGIYNLFGIDDDIYAFLLRTFDLPVILHHLSPLCEYFYTKSRMGNNEKMYVNIENKYLDIICFGKKGLLLANTFEYEHTNDAAYYILNVWKQLNFDQQKDEVHLTGKNEQKKIIVPIIQEYISCVMPSIFPAQLFKMGKDTLNAPFGLIITPLCEL